MTTINAQIGSSHPGTAIGEHVDGWALEIFGGAQSAEESSAHPGFLHLGLLLQQGVCHSGANVLDVNVSGCFFFLT